MFVILNFCVRICQEEEKLVRSSHLCLLWGETAEKIVAAQQPLEFMPPYSSRYHRYHHHHWCLSQFSSSCPHNQQRLGLDVLYDKSLSLLTYYRYNYFLESSHQIEFSYISISSISIWKKFSQPIKYIEACLIDHLEWHRTAFAILAMFLEIFMRNGCGANLRGSMLSFCDRPDQSLDLRWQSSSSTCWP